MTVRRFIDWLFGPRRVERLDANHGLRERIYRQSAAIAERKRVERAEQERMYRDLAMLRRQLAITRRVEAEHDRGD